MTTDAVSGEPSTAFASQADGSTAMPTAGEHFPDVSNTQTRLNEAKIRPAGSEGMRNLRLKDPGRFTSTYVAEAIPLLGRNANAIMQALQYPEKNDIDCVAKFNVWGDFRRPKNARLNLSFGRKVGNKFPLILHVI